MSNEENENEDLTAFERALAALRPQADGLDPGWRGLLAKEVSLTAGGLSQFSSDENGTVPLGARPLGKAARCAHPAGHRFICVHCGSDAPGGGRVVRWAWPAALAAMTSVAAVLLAMLMVGRHGQAAGGEGPPIATSRPAPAAAEEQKPVRVPDRAAALPESALTGDYPEIPPALAWRRLGGQGILTAADARLYDDLLVRNDAPTRQNSPEGRHAVSSANAIAAEAGLSSGELLQRLVRELGVADDAGGRPRPETSNH
jgi:hypothetical protein